MKLFFSPGTCSLSPHIVLYEAGYSFELERVNLVTKRTAGGLDFWRINPKGYVPTLELDDGEVLTEGPVIVQYLADQKPEVGLLASTGTVERLRTLQWLNFVTAELHKGFKPFFQTKTHESCKLAARDLLEQRLNYVAGQLEVAEFLGSCQFTVADAYCFTVLTWLPYSGLRLDTWTTLERYYSTIAARPAVQRALTEGGLQSRPS